MLPTKMTPPTIIAMAEHPTRGLVSAFDLFDELLGHAIDRVVLGEAPGPATLP